MTADFAFSEKWQVLGPFQIGTRGKRGQRAHSSFSVTDSP